MLKLYEATNDEEFAVAVNVNNSQNFTILF